MVKELFTVHIPFMLCLGIFIWTSDADAESFADKPPGTMLVQLTGRPSAVDLFETETGLFVEFDLQGADILARCRASTVDYDRLRQAAKEIRDVAERVADGTADSDSFWWVTVYGEYSPQLDLLELEWAHVPWEIELEAGGTFRASTRYEFGAEPPTSDLGQVYSRLSATSPPEPAEPICVDVEYSPVFAPGIPSYGYPTHYKSHACPSYGQSLTCNPASGLVVRSDQTGDIRLSTVDADSRYHYYRYGTEGRWYDTDSYHPCNFIYLGGRRCPHGKDRDHSHDEPRPADGPAVNPIFPGAQFDPSMEEETPGFLDMKTNAEKWGYHRRIMGPRFERKQIPGQ